MPKDLNISLLCDFYGDLLTSKQKETILLYYNEDLSLSEIAEELAISRQGARDNIQRGEEKLLSFENVLHIADKTEKLRSAFGDLEKTLTNMKVTASIKEMESIQKLAELTERMQNILG